MAVETNQCPKCGGSLTAVSDSRTIICGYCGTEVSIREEGQGETPAGGKPHVITSGDLDRVRALVADGQYVEAIKAYRESTTASLKEAKEAVDALAAGAGQEVPQPKPWSCPVMILAFFAWMGFIALMPLAAEWLLGLVPGEGVTAEIVGMSRVLLPVLMVIVSIVVFFRWLSRSGVNRPVKRGR